MEDINSTSIEQETAVDTNFEDVPKAKKKLNAIGIGILVFCGIVLVSAILTAIIFLPGYLMKRAILSEDSNLNGDTNNLYCLAQEFPYSNDTFTLANGFEIENGYFSLIIPNEMKQDKDHKEIYKVINEKNEVQYRVWLDKVVYSFDSFRLVDSDETPAEMDALFVKHTGKCYPRTVKEINELIFSYTPDDFNLRDKEQCVVMSTIMTWKGLLTQGVSEFYLYEKDGICAQIFVYTFDERTDYIIDVNNMQTQKTYRLLCHDNGSDERESIMKIFNSIRLVNG